MIYNDFHNIKLSALGFRDTGILKAEAEIRGEAKSGTSQPEVQAEFLHAQAGSTFEDLQALYDFALQSGINYFEVSRDYARHNPECDAGKILSGYPREMYYLASGFPGYDMESFGKQAEIFDEQRSNLRTESFDFYLLNYVSEFNIEQYLDSGVAEFFIEQKKAGKIRFLGCSVFGNPDPMRRFLDQYGEYIDFCRFSLNWMDWDLHMAKQKVMLCKKRNIPVWAADPLKNGLLENVPEPYEENLRRIRPEEPVSAWAYRYLQSFPEVSLTLLETKEITKLQSAAAVFQVHDPTNAEENKILYDAAKAMLPKKILDCTGCRRCMKHCIKFLDIAGFMELFNEELVSGPRPETPLYVNAYPVEKQPQSCCHWGPCQSMCPQKLDIIRMMLRLATRVRRSPYLQK